MNRLEKAMVEIKEFIEGLKALPRLAPEEVFAYLKSHGVEPDSLRPYLFFSQATYTRNLVFKNDLFELLTLCWESGQASRIHNHRDQQCWMTVPIGKLQVQDYRVLDRDPDKKTCRLLPSRSYPITPAQPAEVDTNEPVHQVLNLAEFGGRAVSLHLYSKPFDSCEIYSVEKGNYCDVPLYYTSEYGKLCAGELAAPVC